MTTKYRKKPVVIEAFQMTEECRRNDSWWPKWFHMAYGVNEPESNKKEGSIWKNPTQSGLLCGTLEGVVRIDWDDWIIKGIQGELYPCKPEIFEKTYEPVED